MVPVALTARPDQLTELHPAAFGTATGPRRAQSMATSPLPAELAAHPERVTASLTWWLERPATVMRTGS
jgi:hypothetical protein